MLVTILLVLAALLGGTVVGLVPALLIAMALGVAPRRRRAERHGHARAAHAPPPAARPAPVLRTFAPVPDSEPEPLSVRLPSPTAVGGPDAASHDRHGELYDAEYSKQVDRLDALRRTISTRLAVSELHAAPSSPSDE